MSTKFFRTIKYADDNGRLKEKGVLDRLHVYTFTLHLTSRKDKQTQYTDVHKIPVINVNPVTYTAKSKSGGHGSGTDENGPLETLRPWTRSRERNMMYIQRV